MKLWVDDQKDPTVLAPMFELDTGGWTWVTTIGQAQELIKKGVFIEHLALDYDLGYGRRGTELAAWYVQQVRDGKVRPPMLVTPISSLDEYNRELREALGELL